MLNIYNYHHLIMSSQLDLYCRYLGIGAMYPYVNKLSGGNFLEYMINRFKIDELPYNLTILELITEGALSPSLFVKLPDNLFKSWTNFPEFPWSVASELSEQENNALSYDIHIIPDSYDSLEQLSHPYDTGLKTTFTDIFQIVPPKKVTWLIHGNGRKYHQYEAYMPFWKGYVILDAYASCFYIDKYLLPENGKQIFIDHVANADKRWNDLLDNCFERISWFRTIITNYDYSTASNIKISYLDIAQYVLNITNSSLNDLEADLELLLKQHWDLNNNFQRTGLPCLKNALQSLQYDIYTVFSMLCISGIDPDNLFTKWHVTDRMSRGWTELQDVLPFEDIKFQYKFHSTIKFYLNCIDKKDDALLFYSKLSAYNEFYCWIRAYCDLHAELRSPELMNFKQPRQLDRLILFCIRTEALLSAQISKKLSTTCNSIKTAYIKIKDNTNSHKLKCTIEAVLSQWRLTNLRDKPHDILMEIEETSEGFHGWSNENRTLFQQFMFCAIGRNYCAHHSYLDGQLFAKQSSLAKHFFEACLSVIYHCEYFTQESGIKNE